VTDFGLIIRQGNVVTPGEVAVADIGIVDERIAEISTHVSGSATREIDATGRHVFPGVVDTHVHFNEPGRMEWEGIAHGSLALAAGGATTYVDMPLNSDPPTLTAADVSAKLAAATDRALVDFGLWGGLVTSSVRTMRELADAGVCGFKAFMCNSGIPEFPAANDDTLRTGMQVAADLDLPVLVHAENEEITRAKTEAARLSGDTDSMATFVETRPIEAEIEAIERAVNFAGVAGCRLHIVHVSSSAGVKLVIDAAARGVDVSCETCPQYLVLTADDLERLGADGKCAPPPRPDEHQALWALVADGSLPMIVSDHSPSAPELKIGRPLLDAWGGISGCQSALGLMLEHGHGLRDIALTKIARALSTNAAARFRLPGKGAIVVGGDADLAIVNLDQGYRLAAEDLFYRHARSAYVGMRHRGRVTHTILRGTVVFEDGRPTARPAGRFLRPLPPA
jgi:allantoinase